MKQQRRLCVVKSSALKTNVMLTKKKRWRRRVRETGNIIFRICTFFKWYKNEEKYYIIVNNQSIINHEGIRQCSQTYSAEKITNREHIEWEMTMKSTENIFKSLSEKIIHLSFHMPFGFVPFVEYLANILLVSPKWIRNARFMQPNKQLSYKSKCVDIRKLAEMF